MLVFAFAHIGPSMSLQEVSCSGSTLSPFGAAWVESISSLSVVDVSESDFTSSVQSSGRLDLLSFTFDFTKIGSSTPPRSFARWDLGVFVCGLSRTGFAFFLSVAERALLESSMSMRSLARMDLAFLVFDLAKLGLVAFLRSFGRLDSIPLAIGLSCLNSSVFILDVVQVALLLFVRSFVYPGFTLFVSNPAHFDSTFLMQSYTQSGSTLFPFGLAWAGSVFPLFLVDSTLMGFALPSRSCAHLDLFVLIVEFAALGLVLSPRSFAKLELCTLIFDYVKLESILLVRGPVHIGFTPLTVGTSRIASLFSLFAVDFLSLDLSLFSRSLAHLGFPVLVLDLVNSELLVFSRSSA